MAELTQARLRELLNYNPETGEFVWLQAPSNLVPQGKRAGSDHPNGYRYIKVEKKTYVAHRLAWFYVHGEWPEHELDHVNRNRSDNRISNLRKATKNQNQGNSHLRPDNTSGYKGVSWYSRYGKWMAGIRINNRTKNLGYFNSPEDAHRAYCDAAKKYFGDFARFR